MASSVWAEDEHACCDDQAPCCVMMVSAKNCSPCVFPGIIGIQSFSSHNTLSNADHQALTVSFYSLNIHAIWRPPIH
jgi:hypothetical protein